MKPPEESTLIICSIVRDAANAVKHNIPAVSAICNYFSDYRIIIFENDSKDATPEVLQIWAKSDCKVIIAPSSHRKAPESPAVPPGVNPFFSKKRIARMAFLRNQYMDYIVTHKMSADYLMVIDLDVASILPNGVLSCFDPARQWDAVCANGWSLGPGLRRRYHDTYALTLWEDRSLPQTETMIESLASEYGSLRADAPWIRVMSGFGGIAIYRFDLVKDLEYEALPNDDSSVEVRCEHYSIYHKMMTQGASLFFINPSMVVKYQNLTAGIIINHLKRKLFLMAGFPWIPRH